MNDMVMNVSLPLDEDGFLRRECPLCRREFKVRPTPDEMRTIVEESTHALLSNEADAVPESPEEAQVGDNWCPYCGQQAKHDSWWTEEQLEYLRVFARNVAARLINEHLLGPLRRSLGGSAHGPVTVTFRGADVPEQEAWMAPEPNDMERVSLPCCTRELKVDADWDQPVHCFFCGIHHRVDANT